MRTANQYDGLGTQGARLIREKAREIARLNGFQSHEVEDIEQNLATEAIRRLARFNPARGSRESFVARVIDHAFTDIVTKRWSESVAPIRRQVSLNALVPDHEEADDDDEFSEATELDAPAERGFLPEYIRQELRIDLACVMEKLPPDLREIVDLLSKGYRHLEIQALKGLSKQAYWRGIHKIRQLFTSASISDYLGRKRGTVS